MGQDCSSGRVCSDGLTPGEMGQQLLAAVVELTEADEGSSAVIDLKRAEIAHLLESGADPNVASPDNEFALTLLAAATDVSHKHIRPHAEAIASLLIDSNADPNVANSRGITSLMLAAEHGSITLAKTLVESNRAQLELADDSGFTALIYACRRQRTAIALKLLDAGADANATSGGEFPQSPLSFCHDAKMRAVRDALIAKGATE